MNDKSNVAVKYNKSYIDDSHIQITSGSVPASKKEVKQ